MKIRPTGPVSDPLPVKSKAPPRPRRDEGVEVNVSAAARILASSAPQRDGDVDMQRVEQVRARIAAGTYEIDEAALARALLDKELRWRP